MRSQINWVRREFHQLSTDELYSLMSFRQRHLLRQNSLQQVDADGRDPLAWHLFALAADQGLIAYGRICLPDSPSEALLIDRLLCEPGLPLEGSLVAEVLAFTDDCFDLPVECEVTDEQMTWWHPYGFDIVVDRPANRHGMIRMQRTSTP
ncbi:hypothetical protein MIB92_10455 [Aestuariirhabdus sp. Z084]|uniref:hypothetical protein n=1 Tax=Aestuariirhabdus haliotis TaxID=2918751 RepID=UPI00201B3A89|nr:hypothetical protein [Aestuariirhabdus haliotis]MCL6416075.1 hypothetical protein [Aestuariirhabdus haliotis]MCL6419357.1 hypothetical protein [Aestuariirhabdus haliotis]